MKVITLVNKYKSRSKFVQITLTYIDLKFADYDDDETDNECIDEALTKSVAEERADQEDQPQPNDNPMVQLLVMIIFYIMAVTNLNTSEEKRFNRLSL